MLHQINDNICFCVFIELQILIYEALADQLECILPSADNSVAYTEAQLREIQNLRTLVNSLQYDLKSISDLYCQATDPYKLFDLSLRIIHIASSKETELIDRLWMSFIYRCVS